MVLFGFPENTSCFDFCDYRFLEVLLRFLSGFDCKFPLLFRVIENRGPILRPDVVALLIQCRWIMESPEPCKQLVIGDLFRQESHLDHLGMAG